MSPLLPAHNDEGGWYEYKDIVADHWDFSAEMAGKAAGVQVVQASGAPGKAAAIRVRGRVMRFITTLMLEPVSMSKSPASK